MGDNAPDYQDNLYFEPKVDRGIIENLAKELKILNIPVVSNDTKPKQKPIIEITTKDDKKVYLPLRDDLTTGDITNFIYYFTRSIIKSDYSISYDISKNENDD